MKQMNFSEGELYYNDAVAFTYEVAQTPKDFDPIRGDSYDNPIDFENHRNHLGDYIVVPYGAGKGIAQEIKEAVQRNYVAPGILKRKTNLLWGKGPMLYIDQLINNEEVRTRVSPPEVISWLESWDYEEYLLKCCVDFNHMEACFSKFQLTRGNRVGDAKIAFLQHVPCDKGQLAFHKDNPNGGKPTHVVVTDWSFDTVNSLDSKAYPIFDVKEPFRNITSMLYTNVYSFCNDFYTVPDLYGTLEWLKRSTAVPLIFKALSKNSINLKYHIISPQAFWDAKEETLRTECTKKGIEYKSSMLAEFKREYLKKIGEVLSGNENVGKYLHTTKTLEVDGNNILEHGWEVKVIDQNIKDFVTAQIEISKHSAQAVSIGVSVSSSLANTSDTAKANSGNEQYYAMLNYLNTDVNIPEMVVTKAINYALRVNFPGKGYKIGFKHTVPQRTSDTTESQRIENNTEN